MHLVISGIASLDYVLLWSNKNLCFGNLSNSKNSLYCVTCSTTEMDIWCGMEYLAGANSFAEYVSKNVDV